MVLPFSVDFDIFVGLDVSLTDTGLAITDTKIVQGISLKTDASECDIDRQRRIIDAVFTTLDTYVNATKPCLVVIEDYGPISKFAGKLLVRAEIVGALKYYLRNHTTAQLALVHPNELKKFMGVVVSRKVKATKSKEAMKTACARRFAFHDDNDNVIDAVCLAHYGIAKYRQNAPLPIIRVPIVKS